MTAPASASSVPTVREAVDTYIEGLPPATTPEQRQVVGAALLALLGPAMDELVNTITPFRLVVLGGELKGRVSARTGRPLASSTFRRYVLHCQEFYGWASSRWPRAAKQPGQPAAEPEPGSKQHLGELIRLLRTDAGLTRQQLGEGTRLGAIIIKRVELGQQLLSQRQLDMLLQAPCMDRLLDWAEREGIYVELAPDGGSGTGAGGSGGTAAARGRGGGPGDGEGGGGG